jgi:hypothetical protein
MKQQQATSGWLKAFSLELGAFSSERNYAI